MDAEAPGLLERPVCRLAPDVVEADELVPAVDRRVLAAVAGLIVMVVTDVLALLVGSCEPVVVEERTVLSAPVMLASPADNYEPVVAVELIVLAVPVMLASLVDN